MSSIESERATTYWPDGEAEVPTGPVARVVYVSRSEVQGSVLEEMRRIRDRAVVNNQAHGIRVALMSMNGWFVQWFEGQKEGVEGLLHRVSGDSRHRGVTVIHRSEGRPRLFRPWIGSIVQSTESDRMFDLRVQTQLERYRRGEVVEPSTVWQHLSAPPAPDMPRPHGHHPRVMVLSAQGAWAFSFLEWLTLREQRTLVRRRFAGSVDDAPDVESDYADFPEVGPRGVRLVANARKGLAMGMTHAFLPDYAAVVLMLDGSEGRNQRLVDRVLAACRQVHHNPLIIGLGGQGQAPSDLSEQLQRQGVPWVAALTPGERSDQAQLWDVLKPVLERLV